jgi:hypothetical protein
MTVFLSASKIVPFGKENPSAISHSKISAFVGLWSSPADDPACKNIRFGQVGPGIEACHASHTANSDANATSTSSSSGMKQFITSPGDRYFCAAVQASKYDATNPELSVGGYSPLAG